MESDRTVELTHTGLSCGLVGWTVAVRWALTDRPSSGQGASTAVDLQVSLLCGANPLPLGASQEGLDPTDAEPPTATELEMDWFAGSLHFAPAAGCIPINSFIAHCRVPALAFHFSVAHPNRVHFLYHWCFCKSNEVAQKMKRSVLLVVLQPTPHTFCRKHKSTKVHSELSHPL